jgi:hypothetical protein
MPMFPLEHEEDGEWVEKKLSVHECGAPKDTRGAIYTTLVTKISKAKLEKNPIIE